MAAYGRKRVYAPRRRGRSMAKRRRTTRRYARRYRSRAQRGRSTAFTTKSQGAYNDQVFRARRLSKAAWRRTLYRETQTKTHYRSVYTTSTIVATTPVGMTGQSFKFLQCWINYSTSAKFYESGAGAFHPDRSVGVPTFDPSSIVVRGGLVKLNCTCDQINVNPVRCRMWLVWATTDPIAQQVTDLTTGTKPLMYRPNDQPDFMFQFGRIMAYREAMLLPNEGVEMSYRLKPMKIDLTQITAGGNLPYFIVAVSQMNDQNVTAETVACNVSHSMSFSGDAVT